MKPHKLLLFNSLLLIFAFSVKAQLPVDLKSKLNTTTTNYFKGHSTKGLSSSVYYKKADSFGSFCRGFSHIDSNNDTVPITSDMVFSLGSTSKILASTALLKLQEQGNINLDDTLGKYLPNLSVNISGKITIRQLLQHKSGLYDYVSQEALDSMNKDFNRVWSPIELVHNFVKAPLTNPGTTWQYCNTNYLLAGMLIEKITGKTYLQAIKDLVIIPGGLDSLSLMGFEPIKGTLAHAWDHKVLTDTTGDITNFPFTSPGCFSWAVGGYWGRSKDLIKNYKAIFFDKTILNNTSLDQLKTTVSTGYLAPNDKYGLGVFVSNSGLLNAVQHGGSWWHLCAVAADLDNGNVASVCINETEGLTTSVNCRDLVLQLLKDMKNYVGVDVKEIEIKKNRILSDGNNQFRFSQPVKEVSIYSLLGVEVLHLVNSDNFNLNDFPRGVYIIKSGPYIQKVITQ